MLTDLTFNIMLTESYFDKLPPELRTITKEVYWRGDNYQNIQDYIFDLSPLQYAVFLAIMENMYQNAVYEDIKNLNPRGLTDIIARDSKNSGHNVWYIVKSRYEKYYEQLTSEIL